jgi:hypothetical protein
MSRSLFRSVRRIASLFGGPKSRPFRKPASGKLTLEHLEDRLVPAGWDYTTLVQTFPGYPAAGPTHLYLNFDGNGNNAASFTGTSQDIQEILYRTSEIFAPFNVEVSRRNGASNFDSSSNGNTTVFIGSNASNTANQKQPDGTVKVVKQQAGNTPYTWVDYPGPVKGSEHRPNSDPFDVAFVDPMLGPSTDPATWSNESDLAIAQAVAHEAGHTFGLAHVRTDGQADPAPLAAGTVNDMMSYTDLNQFFANQTFSITAFNFNGTTTAIDPNGQPSWSTTPITTQNSFTYLQTVLGARPGDGEFHAGDSFALDPGVWAAEIPLAPNLSTAVTVSSQVSRQGDFNVFKYVTTGGQGSAQVDLAATTSALAPFLQVYNAVGGRVASVDSALNPATGNLEIHTSLTLNPGSTYYFVVGGRDGNSQGAFTLTLHGRLPVAVNHAYSAFANTELDVTTAQGLQAADSDPDLNPMTTRLVSGTTHGTLTLHGDGSFEYVPAANYIGPDNFTYLESDPNGQSNVATVTLTVNANPLVAPVRTYRVVSNTPLTTTSVNGLLAGFTDPNGRAPSALLGAIKPAHGTLTSFNADGTFTYRPNAGFRGTDTFTYRISDGATTSPSVAVTLIVGQAPVAADLSYFVNGGGTLIVGVANGLVGANGDTGGVAHFGGWVPGSPLLARGLTLNADGSFTFAAPSGQPNEVATFQYYVTNPDGTSGIGTVDITIHGLGILPPPGKFPPQPPSPPRPL